MLKGIIPKERAAARRLFVDSLALPPEPSQLHFYFPRLRSFTFARCTALLLVCGYKSPSVTWYGKKAREPRASVLKNRTPRTTLLFGILRMAGFPLQQLQRVGQQFDNSFQRFHSSLGASWQIEN